MSDSKNHRAKKKGVDQFSALNQRQLPIIKSFLIILVFSALSFAIYSNTFNSPFVLDDLPQIQENPDIRITQFSLPQVIKAGFNSSKTRPIAYSTLALNYSLHQYDRFGYHIINITIHILTGFFFYLFLTITFKISPVQAPYKHTSLISFLVALIWLVHPIQTQSITYIVQRMNSLAAMFYILSFWLYIKGRLADQPLKKWSLFGGAVLAWVLALGCKQNAATLPFFIFLYEWFFFQDLRSDWLKRNLKIFLVVFFVFGLISLLYLGLNPLERLSSINDFAGKEFTLLERVMTQFRVIIHYISLIFFPHPSRLNLDYDFPLSASLTDPITTLFSLVAIVVIIGLAVYFAKKERLISFCILWFFGNLALESSVIPLAIIFEHRTYLPSMLVSLMVVMFAFRYIKPTWLPVAALCAVIIICSYWTYERNEVWQNRLTLWSDCVQKSPQKARPNSNLGQSLAELGRTDEAIIYFLKALKINPNYDEAHINIGIIFADQGKTEQAINHFQKVLSINPNSHGAYNNLGAVLAKQGKMDEAIDHYLMALKIYSDNEKAQVNLGVVLAEQGKTDEAISRFHKALQIKPDYAEAHNGLGNALAKQGKTERAIGHYIEALRLDPNMVEAHNNLGITLLREGQIEAAIFHLREALRLKPDLNSAENNLKEALAVQKEIEDEIARIQGLLRYKQDDPELHYEMGNLFLAKGEWNKAINQYEKALLLHPKFAQALDNLALAHTKNKAYAKALPVFHKMLSYWPDNALIYYNIACAYSRLNEIDKSIDWLKQAVNTGYNNWDLIKTDSDLDNIRDSLAYEQLIKGH
jgi:tetratricopeptide (TPR) repeat protein